MCEATFGREIAERRLVIVNGAIAEDDALESVTFYKSTKTSVWGTTVKQLADCNAMLGAESVAITVPVIRMAALFQEFGCPYYVKIDIEGMDLVCLRTLLSTPCRPRYVSMESSKLSLDHVVAEFDTFAALGYDRFVVQQQRHYRPRRIPADSAEGAIVDFEFDVNASGLFGSDLGRNWLTREEALARYRRIFVEYRLLGDYSLLRRTAQGRRFLYKLARIIRRPLPGWYDTHARYEG